MKKHLDLWSISMDEWAAMSHTRGNCGPVAIARATGFSIADVLDALRKEEIFPCPNGKPGMFNHHIRAFLADLGGVPLDYSIYGLTLAQFASRYPTGTYVVLVSGHALCMVDGEVIDPLMARPGATRLRRRVKDAIRVVQDVKCTISAGSDEK